MVQIVALWTVLSVKTIIQPPAACPMVYDIQGISASCRSVQGSKMNSKFQSLFTMKEKISILCYRCVTYLYSLVLGCK
jgi:hypothetical protein